jgi:hypothetical protein
LRVAKWKVVPGQSMVKGSPKAVSVDYDTKEAADKVAAQVKGAKVVKTK